jgi:hypothetical protein
MEEPGPSCGAGLGSTISGGEAEQEIVAGRKVGRGSLWRYA